MQTVTVRGISFTVDSRGTKLRRVQSSTEQGKRYIFDIKRTSREAYDYLRGKLYSMSQSTQSLATSQCLGSMQSMDIDRDNNALDRDNTALDCASSQCQELKERLEHLEEALLCCICMSRFVATVLCPCGHMTCSNCARKIEECPLCRTAIERRQKVYLQNFSSREEEGEYQGEYQQQQHQEEIAGELV